MSQFCGSLAGFCNRCGVTSAAIADRVMSPIGTAASIALRDVASLLFCADTRAAARANAYAEAGREATAEVARKWRGELTAPPQPHIQTAASRAGAAPSGPLA